MESLEVENTSASFPYAKVMKLGLAAGLLFGAGYWYAKLSSTKAPVMALSETEDLNARQAQYEKIQAGLKLSYYNDLSKEPRKAAFISEAKSDAKAEPEPQPDAAAAVEPEPPKVEEKKPSSDKIANALSKALGRETPDSVNNTAKARLPEGTGSAFAVQVASLPDRKVAEELANRLTLKGYEARLVQADIPGRGLVYRVRIHGYDSRQAADEAKAQINKHERLDAITVAQ